MKTLLLASLALVAPVGWAQDVSQKVTFSAPAGRASVLLKKLGDQTGVTLETTNQTKDEVLLIRVKDVPLKDVLERIAKVSDADWRADGNGFRLSRSGERQNEAVKAELEARTEALGRQLKEAMERQAKLPAWDNAQATKHADRQVAQREAMMRGEGVLRLSGADAFATEETPGGRVLVTLLAGLGPKALAAVGPTHRIVYALNPTRAQRPLAANSGTLLRKYVENQKLYAEAFRKRQPAEEGRTVVIRGASGPEMGSGDPNLGIGQAILVLTRANEMVQANLTVADTNGDTIATANWNVQIPVPGPTPPTEEAALELSPIGSEFAKLAGGAPTGGRTGGPTRVMAVRMVASGSGGGFSFDNSQAVPPVPITPALRAFLLRPEENDPQALVVGDALEKAADKVGKNLVASLPDSAIMPLARRFANEKVTATSLLGYMGGAAGLRIDASDAWLQVSPKYPVTAREQAIDRVAFGRLGRTLQDGGFVRLNELANFATAQTKAVSTQDFDGSALRLINAGAATTAIGPLSEPNILRLYATLTPAQQNTLGNGGAIPFTQLTGAQRTIIANDVFTSFDGPQLSQQRGERGTMTVTAISGGGPRSFMSFGGGVKNERTQMLPEGLPANGVLKVATNRQLAAYGIESKSGAGGIVTPSSLASAQFASERSDFQAFGTPPKYDQFLPGAQVQYTFTFELAADVSMVRNLIDTSIDMKATKVSFNGLSNEFKTQTTTMLESMKTSLSGITIGAPLRTGGGTPPPLP
ncbi:MAG: hypothetical protein ACO1SV_26790 [Fimbriimonas sp.]